MKPNETHILQATEVDLLSANDFSTTFDFTKPFHRHYVPHHLSHGLIFHVARVFFSNLGLSSSELVQREYGT